MNGFALGLGLKGMQEQLRNGLFRQGYKFEYVHLYLIIVSQT